MSNEVWKEFWRGNPGGKENRLTVQEVSNQGRFRKLFYYEKPYSSEMSDKDEKRIPRKSVGHTIRYLKPQVKNGKVQISTLPNGVYEPLSEIMALVFIGETPEGYKISHLNGNSLDCRLENLTYVPISEIETLKKRKRLSETDKKQIREHLATIQKTSGFGEKSRRIQQMAEHYGVNPTTLYRLKKLMQ